MEDAKRISSDKTYQNSDKKPENVEHLKRQIKILEDKLKRQRPAERPYESSSSVSVYNKSNTRHSKLNLLRLLFKSKKKK